jgi:hypothetical protein
MSSKHDDTYERALKLAQAERAASGVRLASAFREQQYLAERAAQLAVEMGKPTPAVTWSKPKPLRIWADMFGVSESTVRRRIARGQLRARKSGKFWQLAE